MFSYIPTQSLPRSFHLPSVLPPVLENCKLYLVNCYQVLLDSIFQYVQSVQINNTCKSTHIYAVGGKSDFGEFSLSLALLYKPREPPQFILYLAPSASPARYDTTAVVAV